MEASPIFTYPSVDDVARLLRARTQDSHDDEIGTFTDDTRPTQTEVEGLIVQAGSVVYGSTGRLDDLPCDTSGELKSQGLYWISLLAACLVELSYFPEQVRSDRSPFQEYKELWDSEVGGFKSFLENVNECKSGEVSPEEGMTVPNASWSFPVDDGGMVGWGTRW